MIRGSRPVNREPGLRGTWARSHDDHPRLAWVGALHPRSPHRRLRYPPEPMCGRFTLATHEVDDLARSLAAQVDRETLATVVLEGDDGRGG